MLAFHENPQIYKPLKRIITKCMFFLSSTKIFEASYTNSVDPDQAAPIGEV